MSISRHQVEWRLSGGASNTDPASALGGAMSTAGGGKIGSQSLTASTISGVTYDDAAGNATGSGTVTYTTTGTLLQWTPPSGTIGVAVNIGSDGTYTIMDANSASYIVVTVVAASLPGSNATQAVTVSNQTNKLFDDVSVSDAVAGDTEYRCFYVKNAHGSESMATVLLWIGANTPGNDNIQIGLDAAGKNGTATTIANENTAPVAVTFSTPTDEISALSLGTLAAGDYYPVWIKRTVPVATVEAYIANTSALKLRFA